MKKDLQVFLGVVLVCGILILPVAFAQQVTPTSPKIVTPLPTSMTKVPIITDEQVLNPENWHKAIFNKAEFVIYTGPGQLMFHHWVPPQVQPKTVKTTDTAPKTTIPTEKK
jgi:hypothetical protein